MSVRINYSKLNELTGILLQKEETVFLAESMSGGFLSAILSQVNRSGDFFLGSIVCYDPQIKEHILKVPQELIDQCTAESREVTESMALGLEKLQDATIYIAITGLCHAGGSESAVKPVGTVFVSIRIGQQTHNFEKKIKYRKASSIIIAACNWLIDELLNILVVKER